MRSFLRGDRLILLAIGLCLAAAYAVYYVFRHAPELNLDLEADRLLLTVLALIMALLVVSFLFVLGRSLIKLLVERRRRILGSRFRTRLVFTFLVLVLLPSIWLFFAAVRLIQQVNENLFTRPLDQIAHDSKKIVDSYNRLLRTDCVRFGSRIAEEIMQRDLLAPARKAELGERARKWLDRDGLDFLIVYARRAEGLEEEEFVRVDRSRARDDDARRERASPADEQSDKWEAPSAGPKVRFEDLALEAIKSGESSHRLDREGARQRASAVVPIRSPSPFSGPAGAVLLGRYVAPETAERTDTIDRLVRDYRRALKQQPGIKRSYILLFAILTLLVMFAATWTALYLARQISVPIQALAEGTQAISSGNLDHRVTAQAGDEIGYLIESFNRMTDELRSNREAIELSRRKLEASYQQLEERRQYIEQLLESVPAAVISLDSRGMVTTMNREAFRILGLDPALPTSGLRATEVFGDENLLPLVEQIEELQRGEALSQVRDFELSIEGRPMNLSVNLSARRDSDGQFQGVLIVMEDLTPLIRAQRTAAWREVARRIAHEIKNPLTPIQLSAQRILKNFHEGSDDLSRIVEESVNTIVAEVTALKSLVDEFSRFARMPAISPVPTDPNGIVDSALSLYDGTHPGIAFSRDLEHSPPRVPLDAEQMKRVLINLIDNAIAAMEGRGTISLRTRSIPEERLFRVEVSDNGPGIDPEHKERLFVPYFSTKKRGTGLGLAIVNRIVSEHNGFIRVENNRPRGTRFVIDLPA